ncbi:unnamed protein product, partial [Phytomonas sp. EM1]
MSVDSPKYRQKLKLSALHIFWIFLYHAFISFSLRTQESPDEWWQSAEVAYYLVFGKGELTWEWREGIRSVCFPLLYAIPFYLLKIIGTDTAFMVYAAERIVQAIIATGISYTIFSLGAIIDHALDEDLRNVDSDANKDDYRLVTHLKDLLLSIKAWPRQNAHKNPTSFIICPSVAWTALYFSLTHGYLICDGARAYSNVAEALFIMLALIQIENEIRFLIFADLACMLRVTSAITLFPIFIFHVVRLGRSYGRCRILRYLAQTCFAVAITIPFMATLDYMLYRRWIFTPLQFYKYNVSMNISTFYGTHMWGWYFIAGIPVILGPHIVLLGFLPSVLHRLSKNIIERRRSKAVKIVCCLVSLVMWNTTLQSFIKHKEMRFMYPMLPLFVILGSFVVSCSARLAKRCKPVKPLAYSVCRIHFFCILVNLLLLLFFCYGYRRGGVTVMRTIRQSPISFTHIDAIVPCHTTPGYAQIHGKVELFQILDCSMELDPLLKTPKITEDALFRENSELFVHWRYDRRLPKELHNTQTSKDSSQTNKWISNLEELMPINEKPASLPQGIIIFTHLAEKLRKGFLEPHNFTLHTRAFHAVKSLEPYEDSYIDLWVRK